MRDVKEIAAEMRVASSVNQDPFMATYLRVWADELETLASAEPAAWLYRHGEYGSWRVTQINTGHCEKCERVPLYAAPQPPSMSREALRAALNSAAEGPVGLDGYSVSEVDRALCALGIEVTP